MLWMDGPQFCAENRRFNLRKRPMLWMFTFCPQNDFWRSPKQRWEHVLRERVENDSHSQHALLDTAEYVRLVFLTFHF